jgi:glutaredoxin
MFKVYSKNGCSKCVEVKAYFDKNNIAYNTVDVGVDLEAREVLVKGGFRTVPQVFTEEGEYFGDCDTTIKKLS